MVISFAPSVGLHLSKLHHSLSDPHIGGMNFLNEVMAAYPDAISFGPGAPNVSLLDHFDISDSIARFMKYKAQSSSAHGARMLLREYGPSRGIINELIAQALSNDDVVIVDSNEIVVTAGAQEALLLALRALFRDSGEVLIVSDPCYVGIVGAARLLGIDIIPVNEGCGGIDIEQLNIEVLLAKRSGKKVRAVYVAPDFANPSGALMDLPSRKAILDLADQHDLYLLEDSAYAFTQDDKRRIPPLKALDRNKRVILIGTFAKIAAPGIRVGYLVADQIVEDLDGDRHPLASMIATLKSMVTVNTSPICQAIAGGLLLESGISMRQLGQDKSEFYKSNLAYLLDRLRYHCSRALSEKSFISWNSPAGGFFVRVRLPVPVDLELLRRSALDFGVVWTPMRQFFLTKAGDYEMRLSCSYLDHSSIDNGVERLARLFATL